ncbi:MAG: type II toxin-antitoxin system RelB/DinJ family antitoxin [Solobacterium sp.]|nr:type II toxin-antitoxin system RelB/DinJ family antitoxin [Solobacterium sp.]
MFSELGLNMTAVINIFLRTAIREKSISFALTPDVPNEVTAAVIEEGRQRKLTQLFIKNINSSES